MIIGFDASRAFVKGRTGTENYSYQLLLHLSQVDKQNLYKVYLRPGIQIDKDKWPDNFVFTTINWSRLWTQVGLALKIFLDPLDILFVPAHTLPLIRKPGLKTVVTVHDLGSEYLPRTHQLKQRLYLGFIQNFQLKTATKLIAVSEATKKDLVQKVGVDPKRVEVVYEGYDQKLFRPAKGDLLVNSLSKYKLKPKNYFLFIGTVQPRKNLERLIRAYSIWVARQSPNDYTIDSPHFLTGLNFASPSDLVIVGQKGWLSDEIYKLPKKLGIEDRVKFLGYVPDKDMPMLYSGAIALTYPSLFEGFGLPIVEAQACGCPVITSNLSSIPEVAGKGAILVDPYNVGDIVIGLEKMEDRGLRMELIKKGYKNIKRFSWEKCAAQILKVFKEL